MAANPTVTPYVVPAAPTATSASGLNTYGTNLTAMLSPELLTADSSAAQSIAASTWTQVTLVAINDPDSDLAANAVTIGWGGNYFVGYALKWAGGTAGRREGIVKLVRSGVTSWIVPANSLVPSVAGPTLMPDGTTADSLDIQRGADFVNLQPGDVLTLWCWQSTTGALNVTASLGLTWLSN